MDGAEAEWTRPGRPTGTMSSTAPVLSLVICAVLLFTTSADNSKISSRLPHQILLNTSLQVVNPPVRMDILSVRWEHNERPLVEYKDGNLTYHSLFAVMYLEQIMEGNISLILMNLSLSDAGNYTCVVQYGGVLQTVIYALIIEPHRIRLLNLTPPPQKAGVTLVRSSKKRPLPNVHGETHITARLGENVILPCHFELNDEIEASRVTVHWSKDGVTKYFANKTCCGVSDDISENDLKNGRAPLPLHNVQAKDGGQYTCYIKYETLEGSWNTMFNIDGGPLPYRTLKIGMVSGVVAVTGLLAAFLYFCFEG
ncbi:uncharacterized protein [Dendropsophus ebraccatus]|uniref:uncharacterized protein n=1 Tax=Dendropsophus ebraccatus TaxID=150705 RepID=UPI00383135E3